MLKLRHLFENFDLARACLAFYEYDEETLEEMLSRFRISSNAVYPFRASGKLKPVRFLRLAPTDEKHFDHVAAEIQLIQWLRGQNFPAMAPVAMKNGDLLREIPTQWGTYLVSCFSGVPGRKLEDTEGHPAIVLGYGRTLGWLHRLLKEYPHKENHPNHKDLLAEIQHRLDLHSAPESVKAVAAVIRAELAALPRSDENYGILHYDFEPDNVFYDPVSDRFSVIDFDDAIIGWYALDVVRALDGLKEFVEDGDLPAAADWFLEGYRREMPFTREQQQSLPLMRKLANLQEYAMLLHVLSEPVENPPDWMEELIEFLTNLHTSLARQLTEHA